MRHNQVYAIQSLSEEIEFSGLSIFDWSSLGDLWPRTTKEIGTGKEQSSTSYFYTPDSGEGLGSATRVTEYQKLLDDKNYERTTAFRALSINGGERVDREENERSRRMSDTHYQIERTIRTPDLNGRLATQQLIKEDHQLKGNTEETQKVVLSARHQRQDGSSSRRK